MTKQTHILMFITCLIGCDELPAARLIKLATRWLYFYEIGLNHCFWHLKFLFWILPNNKMIRARVINTVYQFDAKQRNHAFLLTFDNSDTFFVYNISLSRNDIITNVKYTCLFKLNVLKIALFAVFFSLALSLRLCL